MIYKLTIYLFVFINFIYGSVRLGNDKLINEKFNLIEGKRLGIIANHTSLLSNGQHLVDYLFESDKVKILAVFGPEHGFRGDAPAGEKIESFVDEKTGVKVFSLYGETNKPTPEMLKDIEILIYDIQDVGARFYTYISTLYLCMEAAAENNIKFIVCDRPNPIGGVKIDGPILKDSLKSFVGIANIPVQHGFTIGELALFFEKEILNKKNLEIDLTILTMDGWKRDMLFDQTGLNWIKPSPNIVDLNGALIYPGTCLLEATNISEGRGTFKPFYNIGAPFINSDELIEKLNLLNLAGIKISKTTFIPTNIPGMANKPKYADQECRGIEIQVVNPYELQSVKVGIAILKTIYDLYPQELKINENRLALLIGDKNVVKMILSKEKLENIFAYFEPELSLFNIKRKNYLLYN